MTESIVYRRRRLLWLLLFSLFFNLALVYVVFVYEFPVKELLNLHEHETPIVFEAEPAPEKPLPQPENLPAPDQANEPQLQEQAALTPGEHEFGAPDTSDEQTGEPMHVSSETEIDDHEPTQEAPDENLIPEEKISEQDSPLHEPEHNTEHIQVEKPLQETVAPTPQAQPRPRKKRPRPRTKTPVKKQLTFADIARGFLASLDKGGTDFIEREGNKDIAPSAEDLLNIQYIQKLFWYMQREWRNDALIAKNATDYTTLVTITLSATGALLHCEILKPSGNILLDDLLIRGIRQASPYPPLPESFHMPEKIFTFYINSNPRSTSGFKLRSQ